MTKLICPDCQHENEPERIYCHDCGARLDRTAVAKEKAQEHANEEGARQHLQKMFDPNRGRAKRVVIQFGKMLLGAVCLAAVIVMLLPPDLPPAPKSYEFPPLINMDMVSALSSRQPASLVYNEEQVDSYLASTVRRKDGPAQQGFFPLRRLFVQFQEGKCWIHLERRIFSFSIFTGSAYRVAITNGKITKDSLGGYIGRMPIDPRLMNYADILFGKAWDSLARERNSVARLAGIEFHPNSVTLIVAR
jgi:hypothetical protein